MEHCPVLWVGWGVLEAWASLLGWALRDDGQVQHTILFIFSLNCWFSRAYTKGLTAELNKNHRVRNGNSDFSSGVGCEVHNNIDNFVCATTNSKDGTNSYDHQRDSFPHPKDTLCNYNEEQNIRLADKTTYLKTNYVKKASV